MPNLTRILPPSISESHVENTSQNVEKPSQPVDLSQMIGSLLFSSVAVAKQIGDFPLKTKKYYIEELRTLVFPYKVMIYKSDENSASWFLEQFLHVSELDEPVGQAITMFGYLNTTREYETSYIENPAVFGRAFEDIPVRMLKPKSSFTDAWYHHLLVLETGPQEDDLDQVLAVAKDVDMILIITSPEDGSYVDDKLLTNIYKQSKEKCTFLFFHKEENQANIVKKCCARVLDLARVFGSLEEIPFFEINKSSRNIINCTPMRDIVRKVEAGVRTHENLIIQDAIIDIQGLLNANLTGSAISQPFLSDKTKVILYSVIPVLVVCLLHLFEIISLTQNYLLLILCTPYIFIVKHLDSTPDQLPIIRNKVLINELQCLLNALMRKCSNEDINQLEHSVS